MTRQPIKGQFISVEGGEGTGKSTLIDGLKKHFDSRRQNVIVTREPGGTPVAERLRSILLENADDAGEMSLITEALIVSAARSDHVANLIKPSLETGIHVLCDRFSDSTLAYQGRGLEIGLLEGLIAASTQNIMPDLTLLLDGDPENLLQRRHSRLENRDRFEDKDVGFHIEIRERFLNIAARYPKRIIKISAEQSPDQVLEIAISEISKRFNSSELSDHRS